jgi:hypothetical protein
VGFGVEVGWAEDLDHPGQRLPTLEQDGAEHGTLGIQIVRRDS